MNYLYQARNNLRKPLRTCLTKKDLNEKLAKYDALNRNGFAIAMLRSVKLTINNKVKWRTGFLPSG